MTDLDLRVKMISQYPCTVGQNYYEVSTMIEYAADDTTSEIVWQMTIIMCLVDLLYRHMSTYTNLHMSSMRCLLTW